MPADDTRSAVYHGEKVPGVRLKMLNPASGADWLLSEKVHARGLIPFFMRTERELPFKSKLTQELQVFLKWSRDCVGCSESHG